MKINEVDIPAPIVLKFVEMAYQVKEIGYKKYSAWTIINIIRWHEEIDKGNRNFKCSNNWMAHLARWTMEKYPDLDGMFNIRPMKGEREVDHEPLPNTSHFQQTEGERTC